MIELMKGVAQYGTASGELGRKGISKDVEIAGKTGQPRTTQTVGLWESYRNWQPEHGLDGKTEQPTSEQRRTGS
jgi:cell division protein FtsI/penicillin-binding protein 2